MAASPADEPAPWEPVITRPDPMTAEEWEILLEHDLAEDLDPGELAWEDDFLNPDADLTEAELAEIAAAMQERAADAAAVAGEAAGADPAGIAQVLAAQAAAASARRRGPGQPGSARPLAGESSSAAAAFGTGQLLDVMPACPDLAVLAHRAAGDGDSYAGVSDDELTGVLCAWDRLEAHMAARKLAAITELARRRPVLDAPSSGRPAGSGTEDFTADEIAHALAESRRKAGELMTVADSLGSKLPGTKAQLRDGIITFTKAQIISNATALLNVREARAAEQRVLGRAGRLTPGGLKAAIRQAVMEVAPKKAKEHREHAAKQMRVERWGVPNYCELVLVAADKTIRTRPTFVRDTVQALQEGYRVAETHPETAWASFSTSDRKVLNRSLVVQSLRMLRPIVLGTRTIGYQDPGQWTRYAGWLAHESVIQRRLNASQAYTNQFLEAGVR